MRFLPTSSASTGAHIPRYDCYVVTSVSVQHSLALVTHSHFCQTETQRQTVASLVGSQDLADQYIGDQSSQLFLSRGHLAPNADFVFYSWQDQT